MVGFVETRLFTRLVTEFFSDEEYTRIQLELMKDPVAGQVIRGSGGVRKLRWAAHDRGKRGGFRIVYFVRHPDAIFWMLTLYPKNVLDTIPGQVLKKIRMEIENG